MMASGRLFWLMIIFPLFLAILTISWLSQRYVWIDNQTQLQILTYKYKYSSIQPQVYVIFCILKKLVHIFDLKFKILKPQVCS